MGDLKSIEDVIFIKAIKIENFRINIEKLP